MVSTLTSELANRTSRRSFLGKSTKLLLGIVGAGAVAGTLAEPAFAQCECQTPIQCELGDCLCAGSRHTWVWRCGDCNGCVHHETCSEVTC